QVVPKSNPVLAVVQAVAEHSADKGAPFVRFARRGESGQLLRSLQKPPRVEPCAAGEGGVGNRLGRLDPMALEIVEQKTIHRVRSGAIRHVGLAQSHAGDPVRTGWSGVEPWPGALINPGSQHGDLARRYTLAHGWHRRHTLS